MFEFLLFLILLCSDDVSVSTKSLNPLTIYVCVYVAYS